MESVPQSNNPIGNRPSRIGILLMNTGSPNAPTTPAVRRYLREFLMDPHVVDLPWALRALLVYGIILPRRPARSAEAYRTIWTPEGSPLIHHAHELVDALRSQIDLPIEAAMAYGHPSVEAGVQKLLNAGAQKIVLLPLFPQYADATTGTCTEKVQAASPIPVETISPFYAHPAFIQPIAASLKGITEHILFSYHGLPERHLHQTDPTGQHCLRTPDCCQNASPAHATCYRHQCLETTRLIAQAAALSEDQYSLSFQSRLGRAKWMEPYTEETLHQLPRRGIKQLAVVCPAFFCDCLETLEEIALRGKATFLAAGGTSFRLIPCLNSTPAAVNCLENLIKQHNQ